ncbi:MAG: alanine racemase, partial [Firmicutes bacterium]|nr:alanine racemase [Bacillota bacterium]
SGASLCPHGKTTLAPQLFHRQRQDGAWGLTLATPTQAQMAFHYGIPRVLLANEVVDGAALRGLSRTVDADSRRDLWVFADGLEAVNALATHWCAEKSLNVLVETGIAGGRCGARSSEEAMEVARAVKGSPNLLLSGVACYEGIVISQEPERDRAQVSVWLEALVALAQQADGERLFEGTEIVLSAGGSAYFDLVARHLKAAKLSLPARVVLRSGCYLTHDSGHYQRLIALMEARLDAAWKPTGHLSPALEVWAQVLSRPEPTLAFLDAGKRDLPMDLGLPKPGRWLRQGQTQPEPCPDTWRLTGLHDQHARLELPADAPLKIGDRVGLAVSHPCTTFDKWNVVFEVDERGTVLGAVKICA